MPTTARRELPAGRDVSFESLCNLIESEAEDIVQQERCTFERREPLKSQHKRERDVVLFVVANDRVRKPRSEVSLALAACGSKLVQAEPCDCPAHKGFGLANIAAVDRNPASERFLHDVLRIMD